MVKVLVYSRYYHVRRDSKHFTNTDEHQFVCYTDSMLGQFQDGRFKSLASMLRTVDVSKVDLDLFFTSAELDDVLIRCRLLRARSRSYALDLVKRYVLVFDRILEKECPEFVFSQAIDNFVLDILYRLAAKRGAVHIGVCGSYFSGSTYVTTGFEPIGRFEVDADRVEREQKRLNSPAFRNDYAQITHYSIFVHLKLFLRYRLKNAVFRVVSAVLREHYNYHWLVKGANGERAVLGNYPVRKCFKYQDLGTLKADLDDSRKTIYIPLAFVPEMTTDYWVPNKDFIRYEQTTIELITNLCCSYNVVLKEHFHMQGVRDLLFYREINNIEGAFSVAPGVNSNSLLESELIDCVVVGAGSAGVEAILRGVPVITYCNVSYWCGHKGVVVTSGSAQSVRDALEGRNCHATDSVDLAQLMSSHYNKELALKHEVPLSSGFELNDLIRRIEMQLTENERSF